MAKRIYKYPLTTNGVITEIKGKLYKLLSIQAQSDGIYCWIEVDDDVEEISISLVGIGTGWELPAIVTEHMGYVDTVQYEGYVWHYYWCMTDQLNFVAEEEKVKND